ncbi:MAG: hypothetical protein AAB410_02065 [Patescibacteria group bacterium]
MGISEFASRVAREFGWNKPTPEKMAGLRAEKGLPEKAVFGFTNQQLSVEEIAARQEILKSLDLYLTEG